MTVVVRLLGAPQLEADGAPAAAPRGRKSWALLAYLALAERPPTRQRLAALLFPDAEDPMAALRWSLADLRRFLGRHADLAGNPVRLTWSAGVCTDLAMLQDGRLPGEAVEVGGELLEGLRFDACPGFETWLLVERRRWASASEALLHEEALRRLGAGRFADAADAAGRLVEANPLDENFQTLLVRCLTAAGRRDAAREQVARCERLFRRELGADPSPAVRAAADGGPGSVSRSPVLGRAAAAAQLEAGQAALEAGVTDAGIECLRRASDEARICADTGLRTRALIALGSALVHAVRGRDEEGAAVLHEALVAADRAGDRSAAARASRELGFVDVQAGRRERAEHWLAEAERLAADGDELAAVLGVRGMNLSDMGRYGPALETLARSVEHAFTSGAPRQAAWSTSMVGRVHLLRGDTGAATVALDESMRMVAAEKWLAFAPWPETLRAEVDRLEGRSEDAAGRFTHAFALACQLKDPCWEGMAARGSGLLRADAGDVPAAMGWFDEAGTRCMRWPDTYQWVRAYVLDAACEVAVRAGQADAPLRADRLAEVAASGAMHEFVVRAYLYQARLGRVGAAEAADLAVSRVDNPRLAAQVNAL